MYEKVGCLDCSHCYEEPDSCGGDGAQDGILLEIRRIYMEWSVSNLARIDNYIVEGNGLL